MHLRWPFSIFFFFCDKIENVYNVQFIFGSFEFKSATSVIIMASTWLDTHLYNCGILDLLIGVNVVVINYLRDIYCAFGVSDSLI